MTVVIACRFLKSITVIADCRVSYTGKSAVDDNLQKIYPVDERMVIGFSGPLAGAYQVLDAVKKNQQSYSKNPVAVNLMVDVERWIKHTYRLVRPADRKNLSFVLATVEPKRESRSRWRTQNGAEKSKPSWFPFVPELRATVLKPSQSEPTELKRSNSGICGIIGVQTEIQNAIQERVMNMYGFSFKQPKLQAQAILDALMLELKEKQIVSVGGLFQCAVLSLNGVEWLSYGLPSDLGDVSLTIENGQYIQRDNVSGRVVPLMNIWQWWSEWQKTQKPGKTGVFEDPAHRHIVDKSKTNE